MSYLLNFIRYSYFITYSCFETYFIAYKEYFINSKFILKFVELYLNN